MLVRRGIGIINLAKNPGLDLLKGYAIVEITSISNERGSSSGLPSIDILNSINL
jgi:hypothetical protein